MRTEGVGSGFDSTVAIAEGASGSVTVELDRSAPPGGVTVTIEGRGIPGTPVPAEGDYSLTVATPGMNGEGTISGSHPTYMFTIPEGEMVATFTVNAMTDSEAELPENMNLHLTIASGNMVGTPGFVRMQIISI